MYKQGNTSRRKTDRRKNVWPVSFRWLATGTLVVYTATGMTRVALSAPPLPLLDDIDSAPLRELTLSRFDIPAGTLGRALELFRIATGVQVQVADPALLDVASPGVTGRHTPTEAMRCLLVNTGATYRVEDSGKFVIEIPNVRTTVEVTADAPLLQASSPKFSEPLRNTPQTITTVPREVMDQQGATTLRDALRNVAGISLAAGEGGSQGDNLTIRGFSARNDLFIDGMRDFGSYYRDPFNTEEIQVLQGPSSMVFGRGSTGGVVNQSTKYPSASKFVHAEAQFGSDRTRRVTADYDQPISERFGGTSFRLNVMGHEGDVAERDVAHNRRFGVAPSLTFGLNTSTRVTFAYMHQTGSDTPDYGIPWYFDQPAPVDRSNYYGFENGNFFRSYADIGTIRVEHDVNSNFSLRNQARYADYRRAIQVTESRLPTPVTPATPLESITVNRNQIDARSSETFLNDQLDATLRFRTAAIQHTMITGVEGGRETASPVRATWSNVPGTSLLNPDPATPFSGTSVTSSRVNTVAVSGGAYALDTVKLGRRVEVSGGLRWDRFDADYRQMIAPVAAFSRLDTMTSWRAAVVYKPTDAGSVYVASSTSFNPSAESLALSASTANLPPEKNRNYEAGSKWDFRQGRLSLRAALFRTEKLNAREPDPTNSLLNVLAGNQRVDGQQFEVRGRVMSRWEVLSSYAHLDARVIGSSYYPAAIGARLANVPAQSFSLWNNMRLPRRWESGFGANHVSSRTASSTVPNDPVTGQLKEVPGYWVLSAMVSHPINEHIELQANVNNLTNRYYYDQLHPGHIVPGPGRSALIGFRFRF